MRTTVELAKAMVKTILKILMMTTKMTMGMMVHMGVSENRGP